MTSFNDRLANKAKRTANASEQAEASASDIASCDPRARDRVLLYTSGIEIEPLEGVKLALEALQRGCHLHEQRSACTVHVGDSTQQRLTMPPDEACSVMEELFALLRERNIPGLLTDGNGALLRSTPLINRRPMVAEEMDRALVRRAMRKLGTIIRRGRRTAAAE